jgi:hypothetical protein
MPMTYGKYRKKSSKGKRGYRKSSAKSAKTKSLISLIKKVSLKQNELKYVDTDHGKTELYHNVHNDFGIIATSFGPEQGDGDQQRIGNEINLSGIKLTLMFYSKMDRPNTKFRLIVYSAPYNSSKPNLAYNNLFDNVTGNVMIDSMDKDAVKVHKNMLIYPKNVSANLTAFPEFEANKEVTSFRKVWIPYRTKVRYADNTGSGASTELTNRSFYVLVMAYDTYGTLSSDNIGAVQCWQRFYYRDP